jgi:hypothetical protein
MISGLREQFRHPLRCSAVLDGSPPQGYGAVCVGMALGPAGVNWKRISHSLGIL